MLSSSFIWYTIIVVAVLSVLHGSTKKKKLPPGPRGVPILGHLHMIGKNPHQDLHRIAQKHGPIMYVQFGFVPHIIVSSPQAAEQFLKTYDLVFAGRPPHQAAKYLSWDQRNLSFGTYGPYWRYTRKLCTLELLSSPKISSFQHMRREELAFLVEWLKHAGLERISVDLSAKVSSLTTEMSCMMVFGKKYEDKDIDERGFKVVIQEAMKLAAIRNLGDYFPFLRVLDLQGLTKRVKALSKVFDDFCEKVIDDHVRDGDQGGTKDIVDTMLSITQSRETEFQFDRRHVKAIMLDMLVASMDTTASTVEWILSELLKNPRVMGKVQKELELVVGLDRMVEESDLESLEYLDMVVKETFRLHPVAPLLLPHYSLEDCTVDGYDIPKHARIFVNTFAIGRDPNAWTDPEKFNPERFNGSSIDLRGQHFQLLPFGSGRRGCPGMQLGLIVVRLIVAQLVHCFDWKLPNNMLPSELDMTEEFGLVVTRAEHLIAVPTYRLQK
ncbi:cytochrome P450 CYP736A12-like [Olea europaea var. sylvestris]|uniref:cytochrome P450 CYP736A12-like n=1 Tax=Olea europaea var. sylvestris TaxID=158386 RepID=UPI000C1D5DD1|nr:cytochrome P450 CYP736A12-like [Olea europaea var. sylvestris]